MSENAIEKLTTNRQWGRKVINLNSSSFTICKIILLLSSDNDDRVSRMQCVIIVGWSIRLIRWFGILRRKERSMKVLHSQQVHLPAIMHRVYECVRDNERRQWQRRKASKKANSLKYYAEEEENMILGRMICLPRLKVTKWLQTYIANTRVTVNQIENFSLVAEKDVSLLIGPEKNRCSLLFINNISSSCEINK